ncbi:MAG TPA: zinc metalloprotease [Pilimelia sp.]|nr:zinc metalloprotease [Pilimelia sp.]
MGCRDIPATARLFPDERPLAGLAALLPALREPLTGMLTRRQRLVREREFHRLTRRLTDAMLPRAVTIPVYVHVISSDGTRDTGAVTDAMVAAQIRVLNKAYSGAAGGAPTPFRFRLRGVNRVVKPEWALITHGSPAEREMKLALHRGDRRTLNLYVGRLGSRVAGWSTYPKRRIDRTDGVVLLSETLPGGQARRFNDGDTAVHEVGHWLNLYHTFEGGCGDDGDHVADTPAEAEATSGCPADRDSCAALPGVDSVHNYLNYGDDGCMREFTPGQVRRMRKAWRAYRA